MRLREVQLVLDNNNVALVKRLDPAAGRSAGLREEEREPGDPGLHGRTAAPPNIIPEIQQHDDDERSIPGDENKNKDVPCAADDDDGSLVEGLEGKQRCCRHEGPRPSESVFTRDRPRTGKAGRRPSNASNIASLLHMRALLCPAYIQRTNHAEDSKRGEVRCLQIPWIVMSRCQFSQPWL